MKNIKTSIKTLFVAALIFVSCHNDDTVEEVCTGDNYEIQVDRFLDKLITIHPGYLPTTRNYEYTYNNFNLLEQKKEYTFDYDEYKNFDYGCNNNLFTTSNPTSSLIYNHEYDTDDRLIAYKTTNSSLHDYILTYDDNVVTVTGVINAKANVTIVLEINENGLVKKITRDNGYSIFGYDPSGNLTYVTDVDISSNIPIKEFSIAYDTNPNPFYGQFESNYLERFIHYFGDSVFMNIDVFFRYDQFNFPYLKNNPEVLKFVNCTACYPNIISRAYEYDDQNYPIRMEESHLGAPAIVYEYEYQ